MSKTCYINVSPQTVGELVNDIAEKNRDSVIVLPVVGKVDIMSPTKKKKCHRFMVELLVPEDAIIGQGCLTDFGCMVVMRLPRERIKPELLVERVK